MFGFQFTETMSGTYTREGETEARPLSFTATARARSWLGYLRDKVAAFEGTISMEGFASGAPLHGELTIDPVFRRIIRYDFKFTADDGKPYRFIGQKDVTWADLTRSMTHLPAEIRDPADKPIARAHVTFDLKDLPKFLGSFRPG
jgi:hypothetical protein